MGKSRRDIVKIDRRTGRVFVTTEEAESDSFAERAAGLSAAAHAAIGDDPVIDMSARLVCDGCGAITAVDPTRPALPEGWQATGEGDFCADCAAR